MNLTFICFFFFTFSSRRQRDVSFEGTRTLGWKCHEQRSRARHWSCFPQVCSCYKRTFSTYENFGESSNNNVNSFHVLGNSMHCFIYCNIFNIHAFLSTFHTSSSSSSFRRLVEQIIFFYY